MSVIIEFDKIKKLKEYYDAASIAEAGCNVFLEKEFKEWEKVNQKAPISLTGK